ncbi:DNA-processing protein DprA [Legionella sp. CNM-4043-24]|uniref:DNA-processing protein DprA n=1 Tax=Legionella sp. CNM-4043-24 TaxID=3421646 RepID=UPI00403ACEF4
MKNKVYFLALNRINGVGPRAVMKLLKRWPELKEMFDLSKQALEEAGLPARLAAAIKAFDMNEVEKDLLWEQQEDHHLLTWEDAHYPALLKEIHDPPTVLYAAGNLACLQKTRIAMVGTRKPSVSGQETARYFARELASHQLCVVSGLALGIDSEAHAGCLAAQGSTIAVMGTGIDQIYPRRNQRLAEKIRENGLLLTEFSLKTSANAGHFPRRNRIISGLSLATLVVEAAIKSGSLITARLALEQNRDVLAIPGSIHNPLSRGCHHLLQQGARLVTSIQDIFDELGIDKTQNITQHARPSLATDSKNLVKCVGFDVSSVDQIIQRSGLSVEDVSCELAELELQGFIKAVPGGYTRSVPLESSI